MNIKDIVKSIDNKRVMDALALNEISGNKNVICKFSFAGGISGYSFGRSQFDVTNNSFARKFLEEKCEFSKDEIQRLLDLDKNILDLNEKLSKHKQEIDEFDKKHVVEMINYVASLENIPELEDDRVFVHLVDYHNQFNLSRNGKLHTWLKNKSCITSKDILYFKLNFTKWGKDQPGDVKRRWSNIEKYY